MPAPGPVPALPDSERRTQHAITASVGPLDVGFAIYGDNTDYTAWLEVYVDDVETTSYVVTSPSGALSALPRPIVDAQITFLTAQTGTVQIVGARRPRRASQFTENQGVPARDINQAITDLVAQNREAWDLRARTIQGVPGDTFPVLAPADRAGKAPAFDGSGDLVLMSFNVNAPPVASLSNGLIFDTRGLAVLATIPGSTTFVQTLGYSAVGDLGGLAGGDCYVKGGGTSAGAFQSADGQWWKPAIAVPNPKQFGAPCNGAGDDGPGLQLAIDYLDVNFSGGDVLLPPGPMAIDTTVTVKARVNLRGPKSGCNIKVLHATNHVFVCSGGGQNHITGLKFTITIEKTAGALIKLEVSGGGVVIDNIICESGVPVAHLPSFWNGIEIDSANAWTIKDCFLNNCNNAGIVVTGTSDIGTCDSVHIVWNGTLGSGGRAGFEVLQTGDYHVSNCQFVGLQLGVSLVSCLLMDFDSCLMDHCQFGANISPGSGQGVVQTRFTDCQFTSCTFQGANIDPAVGGAVNGLHFTNCLAQYNAGDGIHIANLRVINTQVLGGQFATNAGNGIFFGASVTHFQVTGARCGDMGGAAGNGVAGITITAGCDSFIVAHNDFTTTTGLSSNNLAGTSATKIFEKNIA